MKKALFFVAIITIVFASCKFDKGDVPPPAASTFVCDSTVHYSTIANIIATSCQPTGGSHPSGCHEAGGLRDYSSWALFYPHMSNGALLTRVVNLQGASMPAAGPLPQATRDLIHCWILEGGPQN